MTEQPILDDKAWKLLRALQADGRAPLKALAEAAGLSVAATAERLKRLQEAGVVRGVHADLDPAKVGRPIQALVGITVGQPHKRAFLDALRARAEVLECHHVTGADSYVMALAVEDMAALESFLGDINRWGETRTSIVMSTPIFRRGLQPAAARGR
ncbi:transcriptional regulator, AsnC family [Paracidovorax avenae ATCC 19860]|uniref:Transcriptional regulator, AsnC family n=1 Tax=Paracidovorax avenae (strain ATCC 19860 / DSM 7227 / CCUG 15838 / JCM 20985 / LMG 2117 / NCPPB 1011) TaxID=643561 RepID=F0Q621_PARA1|nr:Lrp/AsnC family transcriptional regulator [Paracidovorax avenae]ADX48102.1 transcriptional regulator, AsnC family [Paracidovorax avenae ATCC 19860]